MYERWKLLKEVLYLKGCKVKLKMMIKWNNKYFLKGLVI